MNLPTVNKDGVTSCCDCYTSIFIDDGVEYCKGCYEEVAPYEEQMEGRVQVDLA
jgi:hypothetical protein